MNIGASLRSDKKVDGETKALSTRISTGERRKSQRAQCIVRCSGWVVVVFCNDFIRLRYWFTCLLYYIIIIDAC